MDDGSVRAFLAAPLTAGLRREITLLQQELTDLPGIRWSRPESLHLTLRFFGDVSQEDLEKIRVSMLSVVGCQPAFEVLATGLGAFPGLHRPRVLWMGLTPEAPLHELHRRLQSALAKNGVAQEFRPFRPHLTLGRLRQPGVNLSPRLAGYIGRSFAPLPVTSLVLYESRLHPGGAEHLPMFTVKLPPGGEDGC